MKRFLALLVAFFSLTLPASAQVRRIGLDDAVKVALEQNRDLKVARLESEKSAQKVREARGGLLPTLTASANATHSFQSAQFLANATSAIFAPAGTPVRSGFSLITLQNINTFSAGLSLTQPLFQGAVYSGLRVAAIVDESSAEALTNTRAAVITDVKKAYYNVLIAAEVLNLQQQSLARSEDALADARALFKQGVVGDIDTLRAFVAMKNVQPALIKARTNVKVAKTLLCVRMGLPQTEPLELSDTLNLGEMSALPAEDAAYAEAVDRRPDVRGLALSAQIAAEQVSAEFAAHLPSLAAVAQFQVLTQSDTWDFGTYRWPSNSSVGLQLSVPIFSGFRTDARVQQATLALQQSQTQLDNVKEILRSEITLALSAVEESRERILVQQQTVASAERSYAITRNRRQQGVGSQLELTDAELALNQAKTNYLQAVNDYLAAKTDLEKSLGRAGR